MGCSTSIVQPLENGHTASQSKQFQIYQKKIVLRNWKFLSNDLTGRGSRIFLRIFQMHPHVKALFPCRHLEGEELKKDANFKGHASRFMQAVGAVVDNIDNYEKALSPLLNGLGRKHIHFAGFKPSYFNAFEEAIMYIWAEDLGSKFDEETRQAWHQVFQFLMNELKQGFQEALVDHSMTEDDVAKAVESRPPSSRSRKQARADGVSEGDSVHLHPARSSVLSPTVTSATQTAVIKIEAEINR